MAFNNIINKYINFLPVNESFNKENYLSRVLGFILDDTIIDWDLGNIHFADGSASPIPRVESLDSEYFISTWPTIRFLNYCKSMYELDSNDAYILWLKYREFVINKLKNKGSINESTEKNKNIYLDKIIGFILDDTLIEFDQRRVFAPWGMRRKMDIPDWAYSSAGFYDRYNQADKGPFKPGSAFYIYMSDNYGLDKGDSDYIWKKYKLAIREILKNNYNSINESTGHNELFLNKVANQLMVETGINTAINIILYPHLNSWSGVLSLVAPSSTFLNEFAEYCEEHYGVNRVEFDKLWEIYSNMLLPKFYSGELINESVTKERYSDYLDIILNSIVEDTKINVDYQFYRHPILLVYPFLDPEDHYYPSSLDKDNILISFIFYCEDEYGIPKNEAEKLYKKYKNIIKDKIRAIKKNNINESYDQMGDEVTGEYDSLASFLGFNPQYIPVFAEKYEINVEDWEDNVRGELDYDEEILKNILKPNYRVRYSSKDDVFIISGNQKKDLSGDIEVVIAAGELGQEVLALINKEILTEYEPRLAIMVNGKLVGGSTYDLDGSVYSFDMAIESKYQGLGLSKEIISAIIYDAEQLGAEVVRAEVVNELLLEYLPKFGFEIYGDGGNWYAEKVIG